MAGIGFELRKLLDHQSYLYIMGAYLYAAVISSGPWLMSVLCLAILGFYRGTWIGTTDLELFRSTVIYTYSFSLIFVGIVQLVATRYLADEFYVKRADRTLSTFMTCAVLVLVPGSLFSAGAYFLFEITLLHKLCCVMLFLVVSLIWLVVVFLSAVKDYKSIVYGFAAGSLVSLVGAFQLGKLLDMEGYLVGYLAGQCVIFFWLLARLLREFPFAGLWNRGFLNYFYRFWDLMVIGFCLNLGIWADKFVFWLAPDSRLIVPWFRTHDLYEGPVFFSYLTILPTLALFLVKVETVFFEHYRDYYAKVVGKQDMSGILREKELMVLALKENMREVLIVQGLVTTLCLIYSPTLIRMANLSPMQIPLFRVALIGSFLQVLLLVNVIILFYFDLRRSVLTVTLAFVCSNTLFSFVTTRLGFQFYGYGYTYACLISLMVGFFILDAKIRDLEFITFAGQPVVRGH